MNEIETISLAIHLMARLNDEIFQAIGDLEHAGALEDDGRALGKMWYNLCILDEYKSEFEEYSDIVDDIMRYIKEKI